LLPHSKGRSSARNIVADVPRVWNHEEASACSEKPLNPPGLTTMIGRAFCLTTILIGLVLPHPGLAQNNSPSAGPDYVLVAKSAKRIKSELTIEVKAPNVQADEWHVYVPQPPELPGQVDVRMTLFPAGIPVRELSDLGRPMQVVRVIAVGEQYRRDVKVRIETEATLLERKLERREPGAPPAPAVAPLDPRTRRLELANFHQFEYQTATFRAWLNEHKLRREPGESDIDLARRAFLAVRKNLKHYEGEGIERIASKVCEEGKSDYAGLTAVYVAALRANGIPARALSGRMAILNGKPTGSSWPHAKVEFYAAGVGWVPADPAGAIRSGQQNDGLEFFGCDSAQFLTLHLDTDVVINTNFGQKCLDWLPDGSWWVTGSGDGSLAGSYAKVTTTVKFEPVDLAEVLARKPAARPNTKKPAAKKTR
jgi:transglutaminase-like putative cysteine protease